MVRKRNIEILVIIEAAPAFLSVLVEVIVDRVVG
jgi:hypothetical protein